MARVSFIIFIFIPIALDQLGAGYVIGFEPNSNALHKTASGQDDEGDEQEPIVIGAKSGDCDPKHRQIEMISSPFRWPRKKLKNHRQ